LTEPATNAFKAAVCKASLAGTLREGCYQCPTQAGADNVDRAPWHAKLSREYPLK